MKLRRRYRSCVPVGREIVSPLHVSILTNHILQKEERVHCLMLLIRVAFISFDSIDSFRCDMKGKGHRVPSKDECCVIWNFLRNVFFFFRMLKARYFFYLPPLSARIDWPEKVSWFACLKKFRLKTDAIRLSILNREMDTKRTTRDAIDYAKKSNRPLNWTLRNGDLKKIGKPYRPNRLNTTP